MGQPFTDLGNIPRSHFQGTIVSIVAEHFLVVNCRTPSRSQKTLVKISPAGGPRARMSAEHFKTKKTEISRAPVAMRYRQRTRAVAVGLGIGNLVVLLPIKGWGKARNGAMVPAGSLVWGCKEPVNNLQNADSPDPKGQSVGGSRFVETRLR